MKAFTVFFLVILCQLTWAKIEVLFHPSDTSLNIIASYLSRATRTIDIAMYNMDTSMENPVIEKLSSPNMQAKIKSGQLQIRIIFEGYEDPIKNRAKKNALENLGIDVRHLAFNKKMHHKFAIIDGNTNSPILITGSANWSLYSQGNYNENILIFTHMPGVSHLFHKQFQFLWDYSQDFGKDFGFGDLLLLETSLESGISVIFNTKNFIFNNGDDVEKSKRANFVMTKEVVKLIDSARDKIQIATTRIKLRPIYNALIRAAQRGVNIQIVVTMGEYEFQETRTKKKVPQCKYEFSKRCSTGQNFSIYLSRDNFVGGENIDLRAKFFNINQEAHLTKQMHSKYIIVDDQLITGSFNWSYSSEYSHIENIIKIDGQKYPRVLKSFGDDFAQLWNLNRNNYNVLADFFEQSVVNNRKVKCSFDPISLSFSEIDYLLNSGRRHNKSLSAVCL